MHPRRQASVRNLDKIMFRPLHNWQKNDTVESPQAKEVHEDLAITLFCGQLGLASFPRVKSPGETQKTESRLAHPERESTASPYTFIIGHRTAHLQCTSQKILQGPATVTLAPIHFSSKSL